MRGYVCRTCGQYHEGFPLNYRAFAPETWRAIPRWQFWRRARLSSDQCEIGGRQFFILGNVEIPIIGSEEAFSWSVWIAVSKQDYGRIGALWYQPGRESEPPYPGRLDTKLPTYPQTVGLPVRVHTRPVGQRPRVEVEAADHPLAVEQRSGITWERVQELAERILHRVGGPA